MAMVNNRFLWLVLILTLVTLGCATARKGTPSRQKPAAKTQAKPVDAKAQKQHYDLGLQHYSRENYHDAKKSFEQVIVLGPNTALGLKAKENLRKIDKILKTLKEIESK